jgi:hypothetical protein
MKKTLLLILFLYGTGICCAQQVSQRCTDKVILTSGTIWIGQIVQYENGGQVRMRTESGLDITIPEPTIKRIIQRCGRAREAFVARDEPRWYHATRFSALPGRHFNEENALGFSVQHSSGWMWKRLLGFGAGVGMDIFTPDGEQMATYPVFAEIRGYGPPRRISLWYSLAGGWGFPVKKSSETTNNWVNSNWNGGLFFAPTVGYRVGNYFTIHAGLRFQQKTYQWAARNELSWGTYHVWNRRFEIGVGVIL